jgi:hypothetical protein
MKTRPLAVAVTVAAAIVGGVAARAAIQALRAEPGVPEAVLTQTWTKQSFGNGAFSFESPIPLKTEAVELPESIRAQIREMTSLTGEAQGLNVGASYMVLPDGRTPSLDGAAEGALGNIRKVPGTVSVDAKKHPTTVMGRDAIEVEASVKRGDRGPLELHLLVVERGSAMLQLMVLHLQGQPAGEGVWQKLRQSVKVGG